MKRPLLILALLALAPLAQATVTQGVTFRGNQANADPFTFAVTGTTTSGSFVEVWIVIGNSARTFTSVNDTVGNVYSVCKTAETLSTLKIVTYCTVTTQIATNDTITVDLSGTSSGSSVVYREWINTGGWNATVLSNVESSIAGTSGTNETSIMTGTFSTTAATTLVTCASANDSSRVMTATEPTGLSPTLSFASGTNNRHGVHAILSAAQTNIKCGGTITSGGTGKWEMSGLVLIIPPTASTAKRKRPVWF